MRLLLDLLYFAAAVLTAPLWLTAMIRSGKIRTDWRGRFGHAAELPQRGTGGTGGPGGRVLLHAVSVGEVNAIRLLIEQLAAGDNPPQVVISTTTNTGFARAQALFGKSHHVVRYPLDFSFAVNRFLSRIDPDLVVLVELEVWPNFVAACRKRGTPVAVINGRLTQRSFRGYQRLRGLLRGAFASLSFAAVQDEHYAERFQAMGVPADRVLVTGTMKWDTAQIADDVPGADDLAEAMGIDHNRPLIVAGSTAPGEHELLVQALDQLTPGGVQLLCAPRKPEWFDQAASAMPGCARRSTGQRGSDRGLYLLDTIGELRQAYCLADVVVIGRSFGDLHGSDMMEPVALGKATVIGPAVSDFQQTVDALLAGGGLVQTDREGLTGVLQRLLCDAEARRDLAERGRSVIRANQGATARHAELIRQTLETLERAAKTNSPSQREAGTAKEKKEERTW